MFELVQDLRWMGESSSTVCYYVVMCRRLTLECIIYYFLYSPCLVFVRFDAQLKRASYLKRDTLLAAAAIYKEMYGQEDGYALYIRGREGETKTIDS